MSVEAPEILVILSGSIISVLVSDCEPLICSSFWFSEGVAIVSIAFSLLISDCEPLICSLVWSLEIEGAIPVAIVFSGTGTFPSIA